MSVGIVNFLDTTGSSKLFKYTVLNYSALLLLTGMDEGDLAYSQTTTGIPYINQKLKGVWAWDGVSWNYANQETQNQVSTNIAEIQANDSDISDIKSIEITGVKSLTGGGDLTQNRTVELLNDVQNVNAHGVYSSNPANVKGWRSVGQLVTTNSGQIKLNWTALNRPNSGNGFSFGNPKTIQLNQSYTVSSAPTTSYPYLANSAIGGQNVISNTTNFLRELDEGQSVIFRVKAGYQNKGWGQNGNIIIRMFNPNPSSNFSIDKSIPTPDSTTSYKEEFEFLAIADGVSLDPLYGYAFEVETTFNDGNLNVYIEEITAFYLSTELKNKL